MHRKALRMPSSRLLPRSRDLQRRRHRAVGPGKPNGTACNDGNACTQADTCQAGVWRRRRAGHRLEDLSQRPSLVPPGVAVPAVEITVYLGGRHERIPSPQCSEFGAEPDAASAVAALGAEAEPGLSGTVRFRHIPPNSDRSSCWRR